MACGYILFIYVLKSIPIFLGPGITREQLDRITGFANFFFMYLLLSREGFYRKKNQKIDL